jgi:hypothetical protein
VTQALDSGSRRPDNDADAYALSRPVVGRADALDDPVVARADTLDCASLNVSVRANGLHYGSIVSTIEADGVVPRGVDSEALCASEPASVPINQPEVQWVEFGAQFQRNNTTPSIGGGGLDFAASCFELEYRIAHDLPVRGYPHISRAKKLAVHRKYRSEHTERIAAYKRTHRAEANAGTRLWKANNPDKVKLFKNRELSQIYHRPFISIDSEGRDYEGRDVEYNGVVYKEHRSVLWAMGGALIDEAGKFADTDNHFLTNADESPLSSRQILDWLIDKSREINKKYRDVNFISFAFNYDVTQILAGLPHKKAFEIARGKTSPGKGGKSRRARATLYGPFAITYVKGKSLWIGRLNDPEHPYKSDDKGGKTLDVFHSVTIYDVFGFYQSAFLKVVKSLVMQCHATKDEYDTIEANKKRRSDFANVPLEEIKRYTALELSLLSRALTILRNHGFDGMGVRLERWSGAGSAAGALMKKMRVADYFPNGEHKIKTRNIGEAQDTAHQAFFGGRIELLKQGYAPDQELFGYDICSAYPSVMVDLPAMNDGDWREVSTPNRDSIYSANILSRYLVHWNFPIRAKRKTKSPDREWTPFFPLPYRTKNNAILFPATGCAWVMRDDLIAGLEWIKAFGLRPKDHILIIERGLEFIPGNDVKPFAFAANLYEKRRQIKASPVYDIAEKAIKLSINSLYGKTAQKVGGDNFKPPGCANPHYAAAITAGTRRRMMEAALKAPYDIVMFATDGIVSTSKLVGLPRVKRGGDTKLLGDWEMDNIPGGGMFLQSGVYTFLKGSGENVTKMRGVDIRNLTLGISMREFLLEKTLPEWKRLVDNEDEDDLPSVETNQHTYMTAGSAVATRQRFQVCGRWADTNRRLEVHEVGLKRILLPDRPELYFTEANPDGSVLHAERCHRLVPTAPARNATPDILSKPSYPEWLDLSTEEDWAKDIASGKVAIDVGFDDGKDDDYEDDDNERDQESIWDGL